MQLCNVDPALLRCWQGPQALPVVQEHVQAEGAILQGRWVQSVEDSVPLVRIGAGRQLLQGLSQVRHGLGRQGIITRNICNGTEQLLRDVVVRHDLHRLEACRFFVLGPRLGGAIAHTARFQLGATVRSLWEGLEVVAADILVAVGCNLPQIQVAVEGHVEEPNKIRNSSGGGDGSGGGRNRKKLN